MTNILVTDLPVFKQHLFFLNEKIKLHNFCIYLAWNVVSRFLHFFILYFILSHPDIHFICITLFILSHLYFHYLTKIFLSFITCCALIKTHNLAQLCKNKFKSQYKQFICCVLFLHFIINISHD